MLDQYARLYYSSASYTLSANTRAHYQRTYIYHRRRLGGFVAKLTRFVVSLDTSMFALSAPQAVFRHDATLPF